MKKIYILHGWAVRDGKKSHEMWTPFIQELELKHIKVKFLKIPGLTAPLNEVWNLNDYSNWLKNYLYQETGNDKVILLGHSFGGQLAIKFASQNSQKVEKLILIDSSGIRDMSFRAVVKRSIFKLLSKFGKSIFKGDFFRNILYKIAREADYKNASPLLRQTMSKILEDQIINDLILIKCPTKIIWGENDTTTPVKNAILINNSILNSELDLIKNARHSPQFTHPKETADLVADYII